MVPFLLLFEEVGNENKQKDVGLAQRPSEADGSKNVPCRSGCSSCSEGEHENERQSLSGLGPARVAAAVELTDTACMDQATRQVGQQRVYALSPTSCPF